jgi:hypothetical protein
VLRLTSTPSFSCFIVVKVGNFIIILLMAGCSSVSKDQFTATPPAKINDFYFEVLEIKSSMHESILLNKPWVALKDENSAKWNLDQISDWLHLRYSKEVERAKLKLLRSHLNTADPKLAYTKDVEETCWAEVERLIKSQLLKTAQVVSKRARLSPGRSIQEVIHESIAIHGP